MLKIITPNWPVSNRLHAFTTTRQGGVSTGNYAQFNLADHVGDDPAHVAANRQLLMATQNLPQAPFWLKQVHSTKVLRAYTSAEPADASFTDKTQEVLAIMTGDCLPILLTNRAETKIAAIHAGWRGLAGGIIQETVRRVFDKNDQILAWLGPAIGPLAFEVGGEVRDQFLQIDCRLGSNFRPAAQRYMADIYGLARHLLHTLDVTQIYGGEYCTVSNADDFFSFRRDGETGRIATLIWRE